MLVQVTKKSKFDPLKNQAAKDSIKIKYILKFLLFNLNLNIQHRSLKTNFGPYIGFSQ